LFCVERQFSEHICTPNQTTEKKSQHNIFSLSHRKQKIIFIHLAQHNHLFVTLYILFGYCVYIRIFCIDAKRKQKIEKCVFFSNWNNTQ
jgi:hypothetical protein